MYMHVCFSHIGQVWITSSFLLSWLMFIGDYLDVPLNNHVIIYQTKLINNHVFADLLCINCKHQVYIHTRRFQLATS